MQSINPNLTDKYTTIIRFLTHEPNAASKMRGRNAPEVGSERYIQAQAITFAMSRVPRPPEPPSTIPDELVSFILHQFFGLPEADLDRVKQEHLLSMAAENYVGGLLERYLASILEPLGWIWCSGSTVKAVDFIKMPETLNGAWRMLQIKNRDNSENSSSSAIRVGTTIEKWFRTFSRRPATNWAAFPDASLREQLSEDAFKVFVRDYLHQLPRAASLVAPE